MMNKISNDEEISNDEDESKEIISIKRNHII